MPNNAIAIAVARLLLMLAVAVVVIANELHFYFRYYRIAPRKKAIRQLFAFRILCARIHVCVDIVNI